MGVTSSLEREFKLSAPERFRLPSLADLGPGIVAAPEEVHRYSAVYYDTEDLRLTRWDCGLRHRTSDGWTVKLAAEAGGPALVRREFHFGGSPQQPPEAALDLLLAITRGARVGPVARLRTIRRRLRIRDGEDRELAEVTNDHVAVVEAGRVVRRFREVELEVAGPCPPEVVEAILARLRAAGTGPAHRVAKQLRALGLESGVVWEVAIPELGPEDSGAQVMRWALARSVVSLVRHDAGVRVDEDVEDVHQMRVATRRLRSQLRSFRPLLDEAWARDLEGRLRELGAVLGRVRDADVLLARLETAREQLGVADARAAKELVDRLSETRRHDLSALLDTLRSEPYRQLVDDLIEAARSPRVLPPARGPAQPVLARLVRRRWKQLAKAVRRLSAEPSGAELHRVRIRAKHTRYAAEAVVPVFGRPARRFAKGVRRVQQVLGDHQDAVVTDAWLREVAETLPREVAFAAGTLAAREGELACEALARWPTVWREISERRRRDWLRSALSISAG